MCGIVAYIGKYDAQERIINGLEKLEYRGYDSAGISIMNNGKIQTVKRKGKLEFLEKELETTPLQGSIGIGHTRWATHGAPSDVNSHPHVSMNGLISVVHNGIIENYLEIREMLEQKGYSFASDTDTEVVANLLEYLYEDDLFQTVQRAVAELRGAYALGILSEQDPNVLVAVRQESPLVIGITDDGFLPASDIPALLKYTNKVIYTENGDILKLTSEGMEIVNNGDAVNRPASLVEWDLESASKEGYDHFLLKEIYEQPHAVKKSLQQKIDHGLPFPGEKHFSKEDLEGITNITMTACGTAFYAAEVGKRALEQWLNVPVQTEIASELKYYMPFVNENTLLIAVSQSGETGDTLSAIREAKKRGARVLAISNVIGSSIARESDQVIYCQAGPEISVASTKAYTTQLISLYTVALEMALTLGTLSEETVKAYVKELETLPDKIETVLDMAPTCKEIAGELQGAKGIFFLGRGIDYLTAKEGALKLKEISYINAEAFAAGELKHGTIALIEEGTPVISVVSQPSLSDKMISNIKEVRARGAQTFSIVREDIEDVDKVSHEVLPFPKTDDLFTPVLAVIIEQLIAYYTAVACGNDVDKPRNLAKSVTVE